MRMGFSLKVRRITLSDKDTLLERGAAVAFSEINFQCPKHSKLCSPPLSWSSGRHLGRWTNENLVEPPLHLFCCHCSYSWIVELQKWQQRCKRRAGQPWPTRAKAILSQLLIWYSWLPFTALNGVDQYLLCSDPVFHHPQWLGGGVVASYWGISQWINSFFCVAYVALRGSLSYRLDYTIACANGPEGGSAQRGEGLSPKVRGEYSQYLHQGNAERKEYFKVRTPIEVFFSKERMTRRIEKTLASKLVFWDSEGHCYSVFMSKVCPSSQTVLFFWLQELKGWKLVANWSDPGRFFLPFFFLWRGASVVVTVTPSSCPLWLRGGVLVQMDVGDTVDLSDLTSHQVEQSFAKHDLKCAGPRANAAVTLAGPSCHLSEWLMRSDSCGVPKTNHCCVW